MFQDLINMEGVAVLSKEQQSVINGGVWMECDNYGGGDIRCKCYSDEVETGEHMPGDDTSGEVECP